MYVKHKNKSKQTPTNLQQSQKPDGPGHDQDEHSSFHRIMIAVIIRSQNKLQYNIQKAMDSYNKTKDLPGDFKVSSLLGD